jgi:hypothetical protein
MTVATHTPSRRPAPELGRVSLPISRGLWKMRNGHTVKVMKQIKLDFSVPEHGVFKHYLIWSGECVECRIPMTWEIDGAYAPRGLNRNDIVGPA